MPMTSRELVYAALDFQGPERIPADFWFLPAVAIGREAEVQALMAKYPIDIVRAPYNDPLYHPNTYTKSSYVDAWGCEWLVLQDGMIGEVKRSPLDDYAKLASYQWPMDHFDQGWEVTAPGIAANRDKFILGGWERPWELMQFLRGSENLYADLADEDCEEVYILRDKVFEFYRAYTERWVRYDVDGIIFGDDWGSQRSLLISPRKWREFFKPKYQELFDIIRNAGKRVFFHSDGYILDIYPDLIEMGVSALNSQVWCMGLDAVQPYVGKITFWGELDRQHLLPNGTPAEIKQAAYQMAEKLSCNGGLIGQCEPDHLTSLENLEAALRVWGEIPVTSSTK
ncbi:MAG: uroporphyrinogen decarboxylase family protein [Armatimonadota bacterium]